MDFSHWNLAPHFSLLEVACLACGIEPSPAVKEPRVNSMIRLLNTAYQQSRNNAKQILRQNEADRLAGKEPTTKSYDADALEMLGGLPSLDLRRSFVEALIFPEVATLIAPDEDGMMFDRDDLKTFFQQSNFVPAVVFYEQIHSTGRTQPAAADSQEKPSPRQKSVDPDRPVNTRERNILLAIMGVLCKMARLDYTKHAQAAGFIRSEADRMGINIGETTIEGHLQKIGQALESRMKNS